MRLRLRFLLSIFRLGSIPRVPPGALLGLSSASQGGAAAAATSDRARPSAQQAAGAGARRGAGRKKAVAALYNFCANSIMVLVAAAQVIASGLALSGCAGVGGNANGLLSSPQEVGPGSRGLTLRHIDAVTVAAREMTADASAQVHGLKSRPVIGQTALDVCGYATSAAGHSTPVYVRLRDEAGVIKAEQGQVGNTAQNLAKVKFMCRQHGDW